MHYSNGREAKIGDLVKGKGYNLKHELVGIVVQLKPGTATCNITIATVGKHPEYGTQGKLALTLINDGTVQQYSSFWTPDVIVEYGQTDAFVALDNKTGEILPKQ